MMASCPTECVDGQLFTNHFRKGGPPERIDVRVRCRLVDGAEDYKIEAERFGSTQFFD